ncbi:hypothetical protein BUALT_Bualt07G0017800 [Buddleja alternifolia]|uniref:NB-ARC domain-containing protein n=1 Tax=Buddleja alternifolia TaxID=168488 RepID=A0AAV6XFD5_9LAMI|nr:hypothetical protein BUALT_Bualt07G0017800 [Buddleja alternifolia]
MAYAAVVSVVKILKQLQLSDPFPVHYPKPEIESLHEKVSSLQSSIERIFPVPGSKRSDVTKLEIQTRDSMYKAQDIIESYISKQDLSSENLSQKLQEIIAEIIPIEEKAKEIANSITQQFGETLSESTADQVPSITSKNDIVGQEKDFELVVDKLLVESAPLEIVPIIGMPGIGKTTLARSIYEDKNIEKKFNVRAWVTVSAEYNVGDIFSKLLASLERPGHPKGQNTDGIGDKKDTEQKRLLLHQSLNQNKYLIVVDDMWDEKVWDELRRSLPDDKKGSRILLTTRSKDIAKYAKQSGFRLEMEPLDEKNSWILLQKRAFAGGNCPPHLVDLGKKIANNCYGLPLSLTVIGGQLSQEAKTVQYWEIVESDIKEVAAESKAYAYMEILSLSYTHLPARLKGCFLYMGAFPEDSEIAISKLIKLWVAEGFLVPRPQPRPPSGSSQQENQVKQPEQAEQVEQTKQVEQVKLAEQIGEQCLNELVARNLIVIRKMSSISKIKSCGIHDILRDVSVKEATKEKCFHFINKYIRSELSDVVKSQRRLSVHKNILMCMEEVYDHTKSIEFTRTLLYAGSHHHHPMPSCLTFDLLRVLDALTVYFIEFPNELIKLIHLRYLSLTYNGKLPASISQLRNLQILILRRYPKIIFIGASVLPVEIWNMPQLRHLLFTESYLPDLPADHAQNSVLLENLQSVSNANIACCTEEVLRHIPNLKKLGVWSEGPGEVPFHLDQLQQLEAFKFSVLNPIPGSKVVFQPTLFFPPTLRRLTLSGCAIPWEHISIVAGLLNLEVLKLREFAFQGPEWVLDETEFPQLKYLLLEYLDFVKWEAVESNFPILENLIIRHCYELEEMSSDIGGIGTLKKIEMVDCSPSAVKWAREIEEEQEDVNINLQVRIYSSWE